MRILTRIAKKFRNCPSCNAPIAIGEREGKVVRNYYTEEKISYTCIKCARSKCEHMNKKGRTAA